MKLSQPKPSGIYPPPQDKPRRFSRNALIGIIIIIATLLAAGGYGGNRIYQNSLQPNVQATAVNIRTPSTSPRSSNAVNDGRVTRPGSFHYTTSLPGTYTLVLDNIFSVITSKSVSLT